MLSTFGLPDNALKARFHDKFDNEPLLWHATTLTAEQVEYAANDVRHLVQLRHRMIDAAVEGFNKWSL